MPTNIQRQALSSEVLQVTVRSNRTLTSQTVTMAVVPADQEPVGGDFGAASWIGTASTTRTAEKSAATYAVGSWDVYVKIVDSPETPVLYAGRMLSV